MMWKIWGGKCAALFIGGDSFDEALEKARKIDAGYNSGQPVEKGINYNEYRKETKSGSSRR